jgi:hypothetical protein
MSSMVMRETAETWHGTLAGYTNHCCRCPRCRAEIAKYQFDRRQFLAMGHERLVPGWREELKKNQGKELPSE